jgi:hypothetical protein
MRIRLVLFAIFLLPALGRAQETTFQPAVRVGLGMGLGSGGGAFEIPLLFGSFRIIPSVGFYTQSSESEYRSRYYDYSSITKSNSRGISFNLGLYYHELIDHDFHIYGGPLVGYTLSRSSYEEIVTPARPEGYYDYSDDYSVLSEAFRFGLGVGGEYHFSKRFSMGSQLHAIYSRYLKPDYTPDSASSSWSSGSSIAPSAQIVVRWYFN